MINYLSDVKNAKSIADIAEIFKTILSTSVGRTSFVVTARGDEVETAFKVVEAGDLIPSNTLDGRINPLFPQELQPRDRTRQSSLMQVSKMANNLRPAQLGDSGLSSHGAPIVGNDLVVESGNGRTMAITKAYREGKADDYKKHLLLSAEMYGLRAGDISKMKEPVLIRVRKTEVNRADFAKDSNLSDITEMAASEKAWLDAENISQSMMSVFEPSESGDLLARSNQSFVQAFLRSLGDSATAGMLTADGRPTKQLLDRMQNAIFAKAYKNEKLVKLVAEEADPEIRNVLTALNAAAPEFVEMQYLSGEAHKQASGAVADAVESLDKQALSALVEAAELVRRAKDSGQSVQELVSQLGLFDDVSEHAQQLALFIASNNRSAKRMGEAFKLLAKEINAELMRGGSAMGDMFGDAGATLDDVIRSVETQLELDISGGQQSMFEAAKGKASTSKLSGFAQVALTGVAKAKSWDDLSHAIQMFENPTQAKIDMTTAMASSYGRDDSLPPELKAVEAEIAEALNAAFRGGDSKQVSKLSELIRRVESLGVELSRGNRFSADYTAGRFLEGVMRRNVRLNWTPSESKIIGMMKKLAKPETVEMISLYNKLKAGGLTKAEQYEASSTLARMIEPFGTKKGVLSNTGTFILNVVANSTKVEASVYAIANAGRYYAPDERDWSKERGEAAMNELLSLGSSISNKPLTNIIRFSEQDARKMAKSIPTNKLTKDEAGRLEDVLTDIHRVIGIKPVTLKQISKKAGRACANFFRGDIYLSDRALKGEPDVVWHEVGHHIEFSHPEIKAAAAAFLRKRAIGKSVKPLGAVAGYSHYTDAREIAVIDDFANHYSSKVYLKDEQRDRRKALQYGIDDVALDCTEIISMGMQYLSRELHYPHMRGFESDTEFKNFMLGVLSKLGRDEIENIGV